MALPAGFLSTENFRLAFYRVVRSSHKDYKSFYRHLFPSYGLALDENAKRLSRAIKGGAYRPNDATLIFQPKSSGVLRPLTLLTFRDLIVYQAMANYVANAFFPVQRRHARKRTFGAIYAGPTSRFFFRHWKRNYADFSARIDASFRSGCSFVADFDLVACYELVDHGLLRAALAKRIKNEEFLGFLTSCLRAWTTNVDGKQLLHGLPQGPEPSAFLAECLLFRFDDLDLPAARYFRYVDDIKLMARSERPLRRALLRLDLASKDLGLVPQAQKILLSRVSSSEELRKTIPSSLGTADARGGTVRQADLMDLFRQSLRRTGGGSEVIDPTKFKFALLRLNARRDVLHRVGHLLVQRPDLAWVLGRYFEKFPKNREAAVLLLRALRQDPTYDSAAASYIQALDVCEPAKGVAKFRRVIQTATQRSEENSVSLRIAASVFRARRSSVRRAVSLVRAETNPIAAGVILERLLSEGDESRSVSPAILRLLSDMSRNPDEDFARYSGVLRITASLARGERWTEPRRVNASVKVALYAIGLRRRPPFQPSVLESFFESHGIHRAIPWRRALGANLRDGERRALRLRQLRHSDPTARVMMLDTFNECLLQAFSLKHVATQAAYLRAAGRDPHPDYGNWLRNGALSRVLPAASPLFLKIHDGRVAADLAHAKGRRGRFRGRPTRAISYSRADGFYRESVTAWKELLREWKRIL